MFNKTVILCNLCSLALGVQLAFSEPLDSFSGSSIDSDIWYAKDPPLDKNEPLNRRKIVSDQLELFVQTPEEDRPEDDLLFRINTTTINLKESFATKFIQADVTLSSQSVISPIFSVGQLRVEGAFFNSKYETPRQPNEWDGEVFAYVRIDDNGDGSFNPHALILRCDDDDCDSNTTVLYKEALGCSVQHNKPVTVSILFEPPDPTFTFTCDNSVVKTTLDLDEEEEDVYDSCSNSRRLRTRIYPNINLTPSKYATSLHVYFDNYCNNQQCKQSSSNWNLYLPAIIKGSQN